MRYRSRPIRIAWILSVTLFILACACSGDEASRARDGSPAAESPAAESPAAGEEDAVFDDGFEGGDAAEWAEGDEEEEDQEAEEGGKEGG